jgi:putative sugar O-methyltransferase
MIKDNNLLSEMIEDTVKAVNLYQCGEHVCLTCPIRKTCPYAKHNIIKFAKEIKKKDLNEFRNWKGGAGNNTIASIGGGREWHLYDYGWNFHPLEKDFLIIDNNFFVKKFNRLVDKLSNYFNFIKFFAIRSPIIRIYYQKLIAKIQNIYFNDIASKDKSKLLDKAQDSKIGNPLGFEKNGKFYTMQFINEIAQILFIENTEKLNNINSVLEVGSGIGLKATTILQTNPKIKYFIIETPPALYISQKYLLANNYKVLTYEDIKNKKIKNLKDLDISNYNAICLAPWMIGLLENSEFDMLINVRSFHTMNYTVVENYMKNLSPKIKKIIYLCALGDNHFDLKKNVSPTSRQKKDFFLRSDYVNLLSTSFHLNKEIEEQWMGESTKSIFQLIFKRK